MPRLPDLEAWAVFAKVAETDSFSRAAADLGLSRATVSKAIGRLRRGSALRLLNRTSRRLSLTDIGRAAAASAARILAEGETMEAEAMSQSMAPRGLVRLAVPMSFGIAHVAPVLPELLSAYPQVSVDLHLGDEVVDLVGSGFDLALRIAALADSSLRARRVCGSVVYWWARPPTSRAEAAQSIRGTRSVTPASATPTCPRPIGGASSTPWARRRRRAARPAARQQRRRDKPALLAGLGLAVQPEFLVWEDLSARRLEVAMADWSMPPIALNIVTPPGGHRPARVATVIEFLVRRLSGATWALAGEA